VTTDLSERQRRILSGVVEEYVSSGAPVASRLLVERERFDVSTSTVRAELAELERLGFLTHPHTSAGRVPTEAGYRVYADAVLIRQEARPGEFPIELPEARTEVDDVLQATTEMLSRVTRLLALVSAPPIESATVRHVDVIQLQPSVVVVVVITSTGGVSRRRYVFAESLDPGLVSWAGEYLRERLTGIRLASRLLGRVFDETSLSRRERAFLDVTRSAFDDLEDERQLYVGGAAGLLDELRGEEIGAYRSLIDALEKRASLLELLSQSLGARRPTVRVGEELERNGLHELAFVAASYGYGNRALGTVSLLGPLRMDYEKAVRAVRAAANELSRLVEDVYADE
jgi:heat-inducible transcriptional repressor